MRNVVEGYGDRYLVPTYSLLDQLAQDYGFEDAGRELKAARELSKSLVAAGRAASCESTSRRIGVRPPYALCWTPSTARSIPFLPG